MDPGRLAAVARADLLGAGHDAVVRALRIARAAVDPATPALCVVGSAQSWTIRDPDDPALLVSGSAGVRSDRPPGGAEGLEGAVERVATALVDAHRTGVAVEGPHVSAPVFTPDGHILGALVARFPPGEPPAHQSATVVADLARTIEVDIALRQTGEAYAAELATTRLEADFEQSLASVAAAANRSVTPADVAHAVVAHGEVAVGAALVSLAIAAGDELRFEHGEGVPAAVAQSWVSAPLDAPVPMAVAAKERRPIVLADAAAFGSWPVFASAVRGLALESFIAMPILAADAQTVLGSLGVGFAHAQPNGEVPRAVQRLVALVAQALGRARAHEDAVDHASMLESIILPSQLPIAHELELDGRYLPPLRGQRVGGDLYDAWVRDDGTTAAFVADVVGHTLRSARTTARLRHSVGMLALEKRSPSEVLRAANRYVQNASSMQLATCCYAEFDPVSETVTIANAGHPQPMHRDASGVVTAAGPFGETLLGVDDTPYTQVEVPLKPGDALLMFSDGLIERRDVSLSVGEERLSELFATTVGLPAAELLARITRDAEVDRDDDVVALVLQRPVLGRVDDGALRRSWPAGEVRVGEARRLVIEWLESRAVDGVDLDAVGLVVTELLTNAREASQTSTDPVELACDLRSRRVDVRVTNTGPSFTLRPSMPDHESARGRGLAIAAQLADVSVSDGGDGRVTVQASFLGQPT